MNRWIAAAVLAMGGAVAACGQVPAQTGANATNAAELTPPPGSEPAPAPAPAPAAAPAAGLTWSQDPASKCQFVAPRSLPAGTVHWTGACTGGKASGLGMLRRREGSRSAEVFYGELVQGVPTIGVIDMTNGDEGGLIAGRFRNGDIGSTEGRWQDSADAFNVAASAARALSTRFKAEKNAGSARFYEQQAKMLEEQVE